jgi:hypothetical protein
VTEDIYTPADVAQLLYVTRAAVSNWLVRYGDTPEPQYKTIDGRLFWSAEGMAQWLQWQKDREHVPEDNNPKRVRAMLNLRNQLTEGE